MVKYNLASWIFVTILLLGVASTPVYASVDNSSLVACYDFEALVGNDHPDYTGVYDAPKGSYYTFSSALIGNGVTSTLTLSADGSVAALPFDSTVFTDEFTIDMFVYVTSTSNRWVLGAKGSGTQFGVSSDDFYNAFYMTLSDSTEVSVLPTKVVNSWQHLTYVWKKGEYLKAYRDGVLDSTTNLSALDFGLATTPNMDIGGVNNAGSHGYTSVGGKHDTISFWSRALSVYEIGAIENSTAGVPCSFYEPINSTPPTPGSSGNFSITAIDATTSGAINTFNASINNTDYFTITGLINTTISNSSGTFDVNVTSYGYYPRTYTAYDVISDLEASLTPFSISYATQLPANNTQFNVTVMDFNITIDYNGTPVETSCDLTINNVVEDTIVVNGNETLFINTTVSSLAGTNDYNWTCSNIYVNSTSDNNIFFTDVVKPIIQTNFINQSIYITENIIAQINFTDDFMIFSWNVSINGIEIDSATNVGTTSYQYNLSESPIGYNTHALNNLTMRMADGHTSNKLVDKYKINSEEELIIASTKLGEEADIPLLSSDNELIGKYVNKVIPLDILFDSLKSNLHHLVLTPSNAHGGGIFETKEKLDRHTFKYKPNEKGLEIHEFTIQADSKIYILEKEGSKYQKWLVIEDKWMDFVIKNEPNEVIEIERVNDNTVNVRISGIENTDELNFESIGELNIVQQDFGFYAVANDPAQYEATSREISYTQMNLTINKSSALELDVAFVYNGTVQSESLFSNTTSTDGITLNGNITTPYVNTLLNLSGFWNYTVTSDTSAVSRIVNVTQEISPILLSNCLSGPTAPGINFSVTDIDSGTAVNSISANGIFKVWTAPGLAPPNSGIFETFDITASTDSGNNSFYVCINSAETTYLEWVLNYETSIDGYNIGQSIVKSLAGDVPPQTIVNDTIAAFNLPLLASGSTVVMNIIDSFGTNLVSYYVDMWLIKPGYNDTIATSFVTDFKGEWMISYNPTRVYKFDIYSPSQAALLFTTNATQVTANPFVIQIPQSENILESLGAVTTIAADVECVKATLTCTYTWDNDLIEEAYFEVFRVNGWGSTLVYNETSNLSAGSMAYTVTENMTGNEYRAVAYIDTTTVNSFYFVSQDELLGNNQFFSSLGDLSTVILTGFFILLTIAMLLIDLGPVGITVGVLVGLLVGYFIGVVPLTIAGIVAFAVVLIVGLLYGKG